MGPAANLVLRIRVMAFNAVGEVRHFVGAFELLTRLLQGINRGFLYRRRPRDARCRRDLSG